MIIKKIILAIIGLFFCLSQVFADDLDLNGIWIRLGFTCQLPGMVILKC